jgi:hypothetical protein
MAAPTKHDWVKISKEYIEAPSDDLRPSLVALASKYNVSIKYIEQKCSKEKWVEQSKIFLRRVSQESKQEKVSSLAGEQTKFDTDILTVARALQGQIIGHLNEAKLKKELLPPKDISLLSGSLSTIQRIGSDGKSLGKGRDTDSTEANPFADILATREAPTTPPPANNSQ